MAFVLGSDFKFGYGPYKLRLSSSKVNIALFLFHKLFGSSLGFLGFQNLYVFGSYCIVRKDADGISGNFKKPSCNCKELLSVSFFYDYFAGNNLRKKTYVVGKYCYFTVVRRNYNLIDVIL